MIFLPLSFASNPGSVLNIKDPRSSGKGRHTGSVRVLATILLLLAAIGGAAAAAGPLVRVAAVSPLTLRGVRFHPQERVHLDVTVGSRRYRRSIRAGADGTWELTLEGVVFDRCAGKRALVATGSLGSRVAWELLRPESCGSGGAGPV